MIECHRKLLKIRLRPIEGVLNMIFLKKYFIHFTVLILLGIGISLLLLNRFFPKDIVSPKKGDVVESIYGLGTVTSDKVFHVRSGVTLFVKKLYVKEGDTVKVGHPLIQLDDNLVKSTLDGTVTRVSYGEGELVPPQISLLVVTHLKTLYLEVSLEQQSILRVKKDQEVLVSFESLRNEVASGVVQSVYPRENQFIVRIELEKWPDSVLPGMTADVAILVGKKQNALLIPLRSISSGQVLRIRENEREKIPVKLGVIDGEWAEVISDNILLTDKILIRK